MSWIQPPSYGEKIDGRMLFHQRRSELHTQIAEYAVKAMADPAYCREWCSALMQLHRMMFGSFNKAPSKIIRQAEFIKDDTTMPFNQYLDKMLTHLMREIMAATKFTNRGDGNVIAVIDRVAINDVPFKLDKIQKQINEIEYAKNLDLPQREDPVTKATRGGR